MSHTEIQIQIADFLFTLDYYPGSAPVTSGPADNWDPGDPAELEVKTVEREEGSSYLPATWEQAVLAIYNLEDPDGDEPTQEEIKACERELQQELDEKALEEFTERETKRHYGYDDTYEYGW